MHLPSPHSITTPLLACLLVSGNALASDEAYAITGLVGDQPGTTVVITDPYLINPWGLAFNPNGTFWVANNGTDTATLYTGGYEGVPIAAVPLVVKIPDAGPTGQIFNPTDGFRVGRGRNRAPALFIFSSENGGISGWNPNVPPPPPSDEAQHARSVRNAVFKGLAIGSIGDRSFLYATDFFNRRVEVFDEHFRRVTRFFAFRFPGLPEQYAPFGIQVLGDQVYVTYAVRDEEGEDDVAGPGNGLVVAFDLRGRNPRLIEARGLLNSPWGLALAPDHFGEFSGALLVGNFGDGRINAFDPETGDLLGTLRDAEQRPLVIHGLWALSLRPGIPAAANTVYFTAGPEDETHGVLGAIDLAEEMTTVTSDG